MKNEFDKSLENKKREIHRLIHQEGTGILLSGFLLLSSGVTGSTINPFPSYSLVRLVLDYFFVVVGVVGHMLLRRKVVYPRIGIVKPPPINKKVGFVCIGIMMGIMIGIIILLTLSLTQELPYNQALVDSLSWLFDFEKPGHSLIIGTLFIIFELIYAIWLRLPREFVYGLIYICGMILGWSGGVFGLSFLSCRIISIATGCFLIGMGCYYLRKFVKSYPILEEGVELLSNDSAKSENLRDNINYEGDLNE